MPLIIPTTHKENIMKEFEFKFDFSGEEHGFSAGETPDFKLMTSAQVEYLGSVSKDVHNRTKAGHVVEYINSMLIAEDIDALYLRRDYSNVALFSSLIGTVFDLEIDVERGDVLCKLLRDGDMVEAFIGLSNPKKFGAKVYDSHVDFPTVKSLYWWFVDVLGLEEFKSRKEINETYKKLTSATSSKKFHVYITKQAMPEIACAIATVSNSSSCMTKNCIKSAMYRFDYSFNDENGEETGEWLHPFRAYENSDNLMVMFSELPPEQIEGKEWKTSPFFARAFADVDLNISSFYGAVEKIGAFSVVVDLLREYGFNRGDTYFSLRGYETSCGAIILPYIDQYLGDKNRLHRETHNADFDGRGICYEFTCDPSCEHDSDIYEVDHTDGKVNEIVETHYCPIYEESYDEDEMTYVHAIDSWVHNDFVGCDGQLDGLAIFRHYTD